MPSPNLAVAHVAAAQDQKEVTINDPVDALDNAMNRPLSAVMVDADLTLTANQASRHGLIVLTGSLTAPRLVTLPANHRRLALRNATSGGQAVTVGYAPVRVPRSRSPPTLPPCWPATAPTSTPWCGSAG